MLVPSSTLAGRLTVPLKVSIRSTKVVLPDDLWPQKAMLRIDSTGYFAMDCFLPVQAGEGLGIGDWQPDQFAPCCRPAPHPLSLIPQLQSLIPNPFLSSRRNRLGQGQRSFIKRAADDAAGH